MRKMPMALWGLAMLIASGLPVRAQDALESQVNARLDRARALSSLEVKPMEIINGKVTYSGIAVELLKADNLLELVNPLAPANYGSGEESILRDPHSGRVYAWKLLSIRF